jgi:hypothetical protein
MKPILITFILLFAALTASAQPSDSLAVQQLKQTVEQLSGKLEMQKTVVAKQLAAANDNIRSLRAEVVTGKTQIAAMADSLGARIANTQTNAEQRITDVDKSVGKTTLLAIISVLAAIMLSLVLFLLLHKRQNRDKTDIIGQLSATKSSIDETLVGEFAKITESLESLSQMFPMTQPAKPDHSLALKVADEITLIERNLSFMDSGTKGLKQLNRSVEKIKDNLSANGYDIPQLLGKPFNQGMKILPVSTIPDDDLEEGKEIISKIIKPQVNYNGRMIQAAQIEVSVGTK